jgi:hypothetical protein
MSPFLSLPQGDHFASVNPGLHGYVTRHNLAVSFRTLSRSEEAEAHWRAALRERPTYEPAWRGLMELLISQERWPELEVLAQGLEGGSHPACTLPVSAAAFGWRGAILTQLAPPSKRPLIRFMLFRVRLPSSGGPMFF